jgi:hypothetical protein
LGNALGNVHMGNFSIGRIMLRRDILSAFFFRMYN